MTTPKQVILGWRVAATQPGTAGTCNGISTTSLWLLGPGRGSREVSTCPKPCCPRLTMNCLMQDLSTPSLSPWQPGHQLWMPLGYLRVARDDKNERENAFWTSF